MASVAQRIRTAKPEPGQLAVFWLSQAGFVLRGSSGAVVYIDPYFSDVVEEAFGFKRMMPCPITPEEVEADLLVCTHEHLDHMDTKALPILARNRRMRFAGPAECLREFEKIGVPPERRILLAEGSEAAVEGVRLFGVYADHGDLAPDAIGVVIEMDGVRVYHTGDTAYRPERFDRAIRMSPNILLPCINGRYGNMNAEEAALLARDVGPQVAIATHFWMFVEHGGDPAGFLENCARHAPGVKAVVMKPGEMMTFSKPITARHGGPS